ncbi:hypothetical protein B0H17DRAFT_1205227 [Mycena rosella]|uniref:F-box domain-containing protein n=1 Tax=Mycena rosella TaxID=1033263 RepID=A0AAD7D7V3_MYCRO|nr:hypothetical protein B0H17DRAFT_1205227 [Mycena rosella]
MFSTSPLDVILVILRYMTIRDALALFATCRRMQRANCRSFWVYVNIDIDKLPSAPGRPSIDYSTCTTAALRARATKALLIHEAWRRLGHAPRIVHTILISSRYHIRRLVPVPWSRFILLLAIKDILVQDWLSGNTSRVPLPNYPGIILRSVRVVWIESIASNVLIAHLMATGSPQKLIFFSLDLDSGLASHLIDVDAPDGLVHLELQGSHLAALCHAAGPVVRIYNFEINFAPEVSVFPGLVLRISTQVCAEPIPVFVSEPGYMNQDRVARSSFLILNSHRFLIAGRTGISIFEIPVDAHVLTEEVPPIWSYTYTERDTLASPQLGPILDDGNGKILLSIPSGNYLRFITIPPSSKEYQLTERLLIHQIPAFVDIAAGFRVGRGGHAPILKPDGRLYAPAYGIDRA